jgi:hypothetical protein
MKTPHVHAAVIHAFADGAEIEFRLKTSNKWRLIDDPSFFESYEYRIKPEPKPDVVFYASVLYKFIGNITESKTTAQSWASGCHGVIAVTLDGESGKLIKVEVVV